MAMGLLVACGGSASESPWPTEPKEAALDPAGESLGRADQSEIGEPTTPDNASEAPSSNADPDAGALRTREP